jgi:hypothetical protein
MLLVMLALSGLLGRPEIRSTAGKGVAAPPPEPNPIARRPGESRS